MISNCSQPIDGGPGDSTGQEYYVRPWYNHPWSFVLRHPNEQIRKTISRLAIDAANNNNIGYLLGGDSFYHALSSVGWEPSKIKIKCDSDCSRSSAAICIAAGHLCNDSKLANLSYPQTTVTMMSSFSAVGFQVLTDSKYLTGDQNLLAGDVLVNTAQHATINVGDGVASASEVSSSNGQITGSGIVVGGQLYSSEYTRADGIVREFCYLDSNYNKTIKSSPLKFSVINYTAMLDEISDMFGLVTGNVSDSSTSIGGNGSYDTSGLEEGPKRVIDFLINHGVSAAGACGGAGNIYEESKFDPGAVNPNGHYGLVQWGGGRYSALVAKVPDWQTNFDGQLEFMWEELNGPYKATLDYINSVADSEQGATDAAKYWCDHYEVTGWQTSRGSKAAEYFSKLKPLSNSESSNIIGGSGELKGKSGKKLSLVKTIEVPASANAFLHDGSDAYPYSNWAGKLSSTQGIVGREWLNRGEPHDNRDIGLLDNHLTICMAVTFGNAGDLVQVFCDNLTFTAVLIDIKGPGTNGNPWGHPKSDGVSPVEWAIYTPNKSSNVTNWGGIGNWAGKKLLKVENYGSWING